MECLEEQCIIVKSIHSLKLKIKPLPCHKNDKSINTDNQIFDVF